MNIEQYAVIADQLHLTYKFESIGPKGMIKKIVRYVRVSEKLKNVYNLSLGDWDLSRGFFDYKIISNNQDTYKILLTVAHTALQFLDNYPNASILIVGSSKSRTRLYQIAIGLNVMTINKLFDIQAYKDGHWAEFKCGINYDAFLVRSIKKNA